MKSWICLAALLVTTSANALVLEAKWNKELKKEVTLSCESNEADRCHHLCEDEEKCVIPESFCRNCAGTTMYLKNLFTEMGRIYVSIRSEEVLLTDLLDFIKTRNFVTLTSKSVYNFVDKFDSLTIRNRFQRLCGGKTEYPIVFLEASPHSRILGKVRYVFCQNEKDEDMSYSVHEMSNDPDLIKEESNGLF